MTAYLGLGLVFASIAFVAANLALSAVTVAVWRLGGRRIRRPGTLFLLRMVPSLGATAAAAALALPAYLSFEPQRTGERVSGSHLALVALACALIVAGAVRAARSSLETKRIERSWRRVAGVQTVAGVRVHRVPTPLPLAALVGVMRPRLYVSGTLIDALTDDECRAVLAHEAGHRRSLDNLKRGLIRLAPDLLGGTRSGREIEAAWSAAAEEAADERAAGGVAARRLAVAGALIAAARLAPVRLATVSNFCDGATIAHRVRRLLDDRPARLDRPPFSGVLALSLVAVVLAVAGARALPLVYALTEAIVRRLQ